MGMGDEGGDAGTGRGISVGTLDYVWGWVASNVIGTVEASGCPVFGKQSYRTPPQV